MSFRSDRVLFIPWDKNQSGTFGCDNNEAVRSSTHYKRKWTIVYKDSPGKMLGNVGSGLGARIHITGHGQPNGSELIADHDTGGANVSIPNLVDMMFEHGLKKYYIGTIACDVCYSAFGIPSFAQRLASELYSRGVKASCVLGYGGAMGPEYTRDLDTRVGDGKHHKYAHRVTDVLLDKNGKSLRAVKSKYMQQRFYGW